MSNAGLNSYFKATSNAVRVTQIGQPAKIYYNDEPSNAIPDLRNEAISYSLSDFNGKLRAKSVAVPGECGVDRVLLWPSVRFLCSRPLSI